MAAKVEERKLEVAGAKGEVGELAAGEQRATKALSIRGEVCFKENQKEQGVHMALSFLAYGWPRTGRQALADHCRKNRVKSDVSV